MIDTEDSEAVFCIEAKSWGVGKSSKIRLTTEETVVIENPPGGRCGFAAKKPLIIPFDLLLAVYTKFGDLLHNRRRVFDNASDIKLPTDYISTVCGDNLVLKYVRKNGNVWSVKSIKLQHESYDVIAKWRCKFEAILKVVRQRCNRPRKLLAFVNPYGGKGEAVRLNSSIVQPLFATCHVDCEVVITERANHARDSLLTRDLKDFDGVICVGGDGMFGEIFNGLLSKSVMDSRSVDMYNMSEASNWLSQNPMPKPPIRVGVIPGGSTDAVAMSIHGTNDVITATLHIILGDHLDVDVTSVCSGGIFQRFSMAMVSYGYFGDLMKRSERYRWLGPKRYDISGVRTFLGNKGYEGTISYVETPRMQALDQAHDHCAVDCSTCLGAKEAVESERGSLNSKVLKGKFSVITGACTKCASRFTPGGLSPSAHLGDGLADLILVSKTSRFNYLRYLYRTACIRTNAFDLPFVERIKIREFSFTPEAQGNHDDDGGGASFLRKKTSVWNCDGELLLNPEISVKVHCQILPVFARGPELL